MNKILAAVLTIALLLTMTGCGEKTATNDDKLYSEAIKIIEEFSEDRRIKDFRNAYDLLTTLPGNKKKFISQLNEANAFFEKYGTELHYGSKYLKSSAMSLDQASFDKYRNEGYVYSDAIDLMNEVVYPVLFEKYGNEAQSIKGITAEEILTAIKSTNDYAPDKKTEQYDGCKEEWEFVATPKTKYKIKYHSNGLVEWITVPIVRSENPLNGEEYMDFSNKDAATQRQIAGGRFMSMSSQFTTISTGYEVLSKIFTDEEITVISNYIHSLTTEEIWERNIYAMSEEPADYFVSSVYFNYKGYKIRIDYGLNDICLNITGNNSVNALSSRWHTVWLGLSLPRWSEETIETYSDYINNNTTVNNTVPDYSFDLDTNAESFRQTPDADTAQPQEPETIPDGDVQQFVPVEMSISEEITVYGVIEQNDTEFPTYRLRLTPALTIIFDEYMGEKVFDCKYLYFYDGPEISEDFPLYDFLGCSCEVTAYLEEYRDGDKLFLLDPTYKNISGI